MALAQERIGLPDGPQLQQNAPNPFNSQTVISYFLLAPGPAGVVRAERTAGGGFAPRIPEGGLSQVHWDGRDQQERPPPGQRHLPVPTGDGRGALTRKLMLLR